MGGDAEGGHGKTDSAAPPSYTATGPPSYSSLFGKVRAVKDESDGTLDFFRKLFLVILGTIGCTICVGLLVAVPIAMIVIGTHYLDSCPQERFIPIYLIVGGVVGALASLANIAQRICKEKSQDGVANPAGAVDGILICFLLIWFVAGNVWVFRAKGHFTTENPLAQDYCHPVLYSFAYWIILCAYIFLGISCLSLCCIGIFAA